MPHPESAITCTAISPDYPKYRNALIIGSVVLVLVGFLTGVHFLAKGAKSAWQEFAQSPTKSFLKLIMGSEMYKTCETFLHDHEKYFALLGKGLKFFPIREEIRIANGEKTATVIFRAQGSKGRTDVVFRMQKRKGEKWQILYAAFDIGQDKHELFQPPNKDRRSTPGQGGQAL